MSGQGRSDQDGAGTDGPAVTIPLLWRARLTSSGRGTGRPRGLDVDRVVAEAVAVADREGLGALTMRRLATELGVATMTLYGYVPSKSVLVELMVDCVYLGMPRPPERLGDWRHRLETVARENRRMYAAHRWMADLGSSRPPLGPGLMAKYEYELSTLADTGLGDIEIDAIVTLVNGFARANAQEAGLARDHRAGSSDRDWWEASASQLTRLVDPDEFPLANRIGTAAGSRQGAAFDADAAFEFGLARILDGVETLIDRQRTAVR